MVLESRKYKLYWNSSSQGIESQYSENEINETNVCKQRNIYLLIWEGRKNYLQLTTMKTSYKVQCGIDQNMDKLIGSYWLIYQNRMSNLPTKSLRVFTTYFSANCQLVNLTKKYVRKVLLFLYCPYCFIFQILYTFYILLFNSAFSHINKFHVKLTRFKPVS